MMSSLCVPCVLCGRDSGSDGYQVLVNTDRFDEAGDTGHLLKPRLHPTILLPANRSYWPGREFLAWHRQEHWFKTT